MSIQICVYWPVRLVNIGNWRLGDRRDVSWTYLPRLADTKLRDTLDALGAVLIEGVKGCGKTATARRVAASEVLLDEDAEVRRKVDLDPRLLLDGDTPRLLDEWQLAPRLWNAVRRAVDDRQVPGQFILTGSATPDRDTQRHSGAGRFGTVRMRTMTLTEKQATNPTTSVASLLDGTAPTPANSALTVRDYLHHIAVGGWPGFVGHTEAAAAAYLDGYLDLIIERDIDEVSGSPRNPQLVRRFLHAYSQMVSQTAALTTITKRAREDADTDADAPSRHTAQAYLDALRRMMIIDEVPAWDPSVRSSKRLITTAKRHLADPSLAAALLRMSPERMLNDLERPASSSRPSLPTTCGSTPTRQTRTRTTTERPTGAWRSTTYSRPVPVNGSAWRSSSASARSTRLPRRCSGLSRAYRGRRRHSSS